MQLGCTIWSSQRSHSDHLSLMAPGKLAGLTLSMQNIAPRRRYGTGVVGGGGEGGGGTLYLLGVTSAQLPLPTSFSEISSQIQICLRPSHV